MLNCKACSFDFIVWDVILCDVLAGTLRNLLDSLDRDTGSLSLTLHASKGFASEALSCCASDCEGDLVHSMHIRSALGVSDPEQSE